MAVAEHAVEMRAADELDATVVAITREGKVYVGIKPTEAAALSDLRDGTVYVKADARAPYQTILAVLDGLRGKTVVLLTQPAGNASKPQGISWPHGVTLTMSR
jgi:biopolymer transport protein ExbD